MRHLLFLLLAWALALGGTSPLRASGPEILSAEGESRFPEGILFRVSARSHRDIVRVTVRFRVAGEEVTRYDHAQVEPAPQVEVAHRVRTDTADRYIPPGVRITWWVEVEDAGGAVARTEPRAFDLLDPARTWKRLERDGLTLFYYGPVESRAATVMEAMVQAVRRMAPLLGLEPDLEEPIRVVMFNNYPDALRALPPTSPTLRSTLVTEGLAFSDLGVILLLGDDPQVRGVIAHEVTHILVHRATREAVLPIPAWLNEGLAEYGNVEPTGTYDAYLQEGIRRNRLFPLTALNTLPGRPEDVILAYGQARSVVRYLIEVYGPERMTALIRALNGGQDIDSALRTVYGFDRRELDRRWREWVGAPPPPAEEAPRLPPTPTPLPTFAPERFYPTPTPTPAGPPAPTPTTPPGGCRPGAGVALEVLLLPLAAALRARSRRPSGSGPGG